MREHVAYWKIAAHMGWDPANTLFLYLLSRRDHPVKVTSWLYAWLSERVYGDESMADEVEEALDALLQGGQVLRLAGELHVNDSFLDQVVGAPRGGRA